MLRFTLLAALSSLLFLGAQSANLFFYDSADSSYLQQGSDVKLCKHSLSNVIAAATGLIPVADLDATASDKIQQVLKPSPFRKPSAYVALTVPGLSGDDLKAVFGAKQHVAAELKTGSSDAAATVVDSVAAVAARNADVKLNLLDVEAYQSCKGSCVDEYIASAAQKCKGKLMMADKPVQGRLTMETGSVLELSNKEDKMFAVELGSIVAGAKALLEPVKQRNQLHMDQQDVELYELTLLGLQGLAQKYGLASPEVAAARAAFVDLLSWLVQEFDAAYGGDVVYQVAVPDAVPLKSATIQSLASWKDVSRRHLLQAAAATSTTNAKRFSAKAVGYGAFILLLYFSLAAIHCMCNMPIKKDTLLFGAKKTE